MNRIAPIFAFMIAVAIFFGYVYPTWAGSIANIKKSIITSESALEASDAYTARQNALATARDAIDPANLERLKVFLPDSVDNIGLMLDLDALATNTGIVLSDIDVASDVKTASMSDDVVGAAPDPVGSVDMSISAIGTYAALKAFLMSIENSARILEVRQISVKGSDTGVYTYQMKVRIFWLR